MARLLFNRSRQRNNWLTWLADAACIGVLGSLLAITIALQAGIGGARQPTLTDTHWTLQQVGGWQVTSESQAAQPSLMLQDQGQRVHAKSDCSHLTGRYAQPGLPRQLRLNLHKTDRRRCSVESDITQAYASALARSRGETIEGAILVLRDLEGRPLARFRAANES